MALNLSQYHRAMLLLDRLSHQRKRLDDRIPKSHDLSYRYLYDRQQSDLTNGEIKQHLGDLAAIEIELRQFVRKHTNGLPGFHPEGTCATSRRATLKRS